MHGCREGGEVMVGTSQIKQLVAREGENLLQFLGQHNVLLDITICHGLVVQLDELVVG
jgi:hypothetical protein